MTHRTTALAGALLALAAMPQAAGAQLSIRESERARAVARIQAQEQGKVLDAQRAKDRVEAARLAANEEQRRSHERSVADIDRRYRGRTACTARGGLWDAFNEVCRKW